MENSRRDRLGEEIHLQAGKLNKNVPKYRARMKLPAMAFGAPPDPLRQEPVTSAVASQSENNADDSPAAGDFPTNEREKRQLEELLQTLTRQQQQQGELLKEIRSHLRVCDRQVRTDQVRKFINCKLEIRSMTTSLVFFWFGSSLLEIETTDCPELNQENVNHLGYQLKTETGNLEQICITTNSIPIMEASRLSNSKP